MLPFIENIYIYILHYYQHYIYTKHSLNIFDNSIGGGLEPFISFLKNIKRFQPVELQDSQ